ncbi:MAG: DUF1059 domain-containing protein [Candidatus Poseidoniales archaeon]|jgi:hypothetical protein|tara:strand:- start:80 stop:319 length:240 start_codon:yes stop_codon:yes gene_type:complete
MKTMTCLQLGGACGKEFTAETFDELGEMAKKHGTEMFQTSDAAHMAAMQKVMVLMQNPDAMNKWFQSMKETFDALPNDQ